jgi:hypothetical protein
MEMHMKSTIFTITILIGIIINVSCLERKNSIPDLPYVFITEWESKGSGDRKFNNFAGITADLEGNVYVIDVYVTDCMNCQIQVFDSNGRFITKWGSKGSGDGQFNELRGIAVNSSGNIYVADSFNRRIQVFDSKGNFINKWGSREIEEELSIDSKTIDKVKGKISKDSLLKLKKLKDSGYHSSRRSRVAYDLEHLKFTSKEIELITGFNIDKDVSFSDDIAIDVNGYVYVACVYG